MIKLRKKKSQTYTISDAKVETATDSAKVKRQLQGFPGGAVVGGPPANSGDTGSGPGLGVSHMPRSDQDRAPQLLSLRSRAHEPQLLKPVRLEPMIRNKRGHRNERPTHRSEGWPPLAATGESPRMAAGTERSQKINKIKTNKFKIYIQLQKKSGQL